MTQPSLNKKAKQLYHFRFNQFKHDESPAKILLFYRMLTHLVDMEGIYYLPAVDGKQAHIHVTKEQQGYCSHCGGVIRQFSPEDILLIVKSSNRAGLVGPNMQLTKPSNCPILSFNRNDL